jgi:hypothetical protein
MFDRDVTVLMCEKLFSDLRDRDAAIILAKGGILSTGYFGDRMPDPKIFHLYGSKLSGRGMTLYLNPKVARHVITKCTESKERKSLTDDLITIMRRFGHYSFFHDLIVDLKHVDETEDTDRDLKFIEDLATIFYGDDGERVRGMKNVILHLRNCLYVYNGRLPDLFPRDFTTKDGTVHSTKEFLDSAIKNRSDLREFYSDIFDTIKRDKSSCLSYTIFSLEKDPEISKLGFRDRVIDGIAKWTEVEYVVPYRSMYCENIRREFKQRTLQFFKNN